MSTGPRITGELAPESCKGMLFMRSMMALLIALGFAPSLTADSPQLGGLSREFETTVGPFLKAYCLCCHGESKQESAFDLSLFTSLDTVKADPGHWGDRSHATQGRGDAAGGRTETSLR